MKKIIIDFEMNYQKGCQREIIEIGAVMLSDENENLSEFHSYVKPVCKLNDRIIKLTGITEQTVKNADPLSDVLDSFFEWANREGPYSVYSWSMTDFNQLLDETVTKDIRNKNIPVALDNWYDYQQEFGSMINFPGCLSLKNAAMAVLGGFEGEQHNALQDAKNMAEILAYAMKNTKKLDTIRELFAPKKTSNSISDLFPDLATLVFG